MNTDKIRYIGLSFLENNYKVHIYPLKQGFKRGHFELIFEMESYITACLSMQTFILCLNSSKLIVKCG